MHAKTDTVDQNIKKGVPAPGHYDLQNASNPKLCKSPVFSMGSSKRLPLGGTKESKFKPGPGRYNHGINHMASAP